MPSPITPYDRFLIRKGFIPSALMQVDFIDNKKRISLDRTVMDFMDESQPVAYAIIIYMAVKVQNNSTVKYTIDELISATGKNRVTVKRALNFLIDSDYVIPVRNRPASQVNL